jgi:hypothetical protein
MLPVGKTYSMLREGIERISRGEDVGIGMIETHGRKAVVELASKLEMVPRRIMKYREPSSMRGTWKLSSSGTREWHWSMRHKLSRAALSLYTSTWGKT